MLWQRRFLTFNTWLALVENEWINPVQSGTEETKWKTQKRRKCDPRPCTISAVTPSLGTNLEHLQPYWNSISWSLVGCIFDTNDKISHFTEKWGHVCLLLESLVFFFLINNTHCVSGTVAACHLFHTSKYVVLIIKNHLLSVCTIEPDQSLSLLFTSSVGLVRCCSWALLQERLQQTTVRPPGQQWTGTNHQSEWLLMELEQLPRTIKKGRKNINSDVLKGGVGGGAADARLFISAKLLNKMSPPSVWRCQLNYKLCHSLRQSSIKSVLSQPTK